MGSGPWEFRGLGLIGFSVSACLGFSPGLRVGASGLAWD